MASIPRYSATGGGLGTPDSPTHIYPDASLEAVGRLGADVEQGAQTAAGIVGRIRSTQDNTTFAMFRSNYNASLAQAQEQATVDPRVAENPLNFERVFAEKQQQIQESLLRDAPNTAVKTMLQDHFAISNPPLSIAAQKQGMQLAVFKNKADLEILGAKNKELASGTSSSVLRDSYIEQVKSAHDVAVANGLENAKVAEHAKLVYEQDVLAANAEHFRRTDPAMFESIRKEGGYSNLATGRLDKILAEVTNDQERASRLAEHETMLNTRAARNFYHGAANNGQLDEETIANGEAGHDPWIPAQEWPAIRELNANQGRRTQHHPAVDALRDRHFSAPEGETLARISQSRQEANALSAELGQTPEDLIKFKEHLATVERTLLNTGRVIQNQDFVKAQKRMDDYLKETFKPGSQFAIGEPTAARNKLTSETAAAHLHLSEFARENPGADIYKEADRWITEQQRNRENDIKNQPPARKTLKDLQDANKARRGE